MGNSKTIVLGRLLAMTTDRIHQNQEVYDTYIGISPTLKANHYKDPPRILEGNYESCMCNCSK
jgi:hypothetical protein